MPLTQANILAIFTLVGSTVALPQQRGNDLDERMPRQGSTEIVVQDARLRLGHSSIVSKYNPHSLSISESRKPIRILYS